MASSSFVNCSIRSCALASPARYVLADCTTPASKVDVISAIVFNSSSFGESKGATYSGAVDDARLPSSGAVWRSLGCGFGVACRVPGLGAVMLCVGTVGKEADSLDAPWGSIGCTMKVLRLERSPSGGISGWEPLEAMATRYPVSKCSTIGLLSGAMLQEFSLGG